MDLYAHVSGLELTVESVELERKELRVTPEWSRVTTIVHLRGDGADGVGEDVTYQPEPHDLPPIPDVVGSWTLDVYSDHLEGFDFFEHPPEDDAARDYRRWAWESAALDLALKQAGTDLARTLGRERNPVTYVVSTRAANVFPLLELYPDLRFKLDPDREWPDEFIDRLSELSCVDTADFKGVFRGSFGNPPDPAVPADRGSVSARVARGSRAERGDGRGSAPVPRPDHLGRADPFPRGRGSACRSRRSA